MTNKPDNEASGVVSTALTNLALYRDPVVALNTASCDFRINDLINHVEDGLLAVTDSENGGRWSMSDSTKKGVQKAEEVKTPVP